MKLYQKTIAGKTKWTEVFTDGPDLVTRWGLMDSKKSQETRKTCISMNEGKANATTPETQAIAEMESKITKKKKEGYVENLDDAKAVVDVDIDLNSLTESFCPSKPISKTPSKVLDNPLTYAQRKHNGHCIILKKKDGNKIYSRRMEDITEYLEVIPEIEEVFKNVPEGTLVLTEFVYTNSKGVESPRHIARIVRKKNRGEVMRRYNESIRNGNFQIVPFDVMFYEEAFIGDLDYTERYALLESMKLKNIPEIIGNWKCTKFKNEVKEKGWEGFVLREPGETSHIAYSLNGKPLRKGAYKFKFLHEDDFIVMKATKGKAGKHAGFYAQFKLAQYMKDGRLVDFGNCGPGKLTHDELKELTERLDSDALSLPCVIEVEYQSRQADSGKLEFPQFLRLREDKSPEECVTEFEFETV